MAKSGGTPVTPMEEDRRHAWRADIIPISTRASIRRKRGMGPTNPCRLSGWWRDRFPAGGRASVRRAGRRYPGTGQGALTRVAMSPPPHISHRALSASAERTGMVHSTIHNIPGATGWNRPGPRHPRCRWIPVAGGRYMMQSDLCQSARPRRRAIGERNAADLGSRHCRAHRDHCRRAEPPRTRAHDCRRNGTACPGTSHANFGRFRLTNDFSRDPRFFRCRRDFSLAVSRGIRHNGAWTDKCGHIWMPTPSAGRRPVTCGSPMRDPAREAHGAAPLGRDGGQAPLPGFPASPRPGLALCGDPARAVAGAGGLAGRYVQVRAARPLDRLGAGAAIPASGPERGQHPVFGARGARCGAEPRLVLSRGDDPPALPRLAVGPRPRHPRAGTFRYPELYSGAMYRASGWHGPGATRGFSRANGGYTDPHGKPRRMLVRPPPRDARRLPARPAPLPPDVEPPADPDRAPRDPATMRSLHAEPAGIQDWRRGRGRRHTVACTLTVTVPATLANMRDCSAAGRFGKALWRGELAAIGAWRNKKTGLSGPPAKSTIHRALAAVDPEALQDVLRRWSGTGIQIARALTADGKRIRAANRNGAGHPGRWH